MHADIMPEIQSTIAANIEEQQRIGADWRTKFNHVRPHEALGMKTSADLYRPSGRRAIVRAGGHPPDCQRRVVDDRGWVRYEMMHVYVATALAGQTSDGKRYPSDNELSVRFAGEPSGLAFLSARYTRS